MARTLSFLIFCVIFYSISALMSFLKEGSDGKDEVESKKELAKKVLTLEDELVKERLKNLNQATNITELFAGEEVIKESIDNRITALLELREGDLSSEILEKIGENTKNVLLRIRKNKIEIISSIQRSNDEGIDFKAYKDVKEYLNQNKLILENIKKELSYLNEVDKLVFGFLLEDEANKHRYPKFVKGFHKGPVDQLELGVKQYNVVSLRCISMVCEVLTMNALQDNWVENGDGAIEFIFDEDLELWNHYQEDQQFLDDCLIIIDDMSVGDLSRSLNEEKIKRTSNKLHSLFAFLESEFNYAHLNDPLKDFGHPYHDLFRNTNFAIKGDIQQSISNIEKFERLISSNKAQLENVIENAEMVKKNCPDVVNASIVRNLDLEIDKQELVRLEKSCKATHKGLTFLFENYDNWLLKAGEFVFSDELLQEKYRELSVGMIVAHLTLEDLEIPTSTSK